MKDSIKVYIGRGHGLGGHAHEFFCYSREVFHNNDSNIGSGYLHANGEWEYGCLANERNPTSGYFNSVEEIVTLLSSMFDEIEYEYEPGVSP